MIRVGYILILEDANFVFLITKFFFSYFTYSEIIIHSFKMLKANLLTCYDSVSYHELNEGGCVRSY